MISRIAVVFFAFLFGALTSTAALSVDETESKRKFYQRIKPVPEKLNLTPEAVSKNTYVSGSVSVLENLYALGFEVIWPLNAVVAKPLGKLLSAPSSLMSVHEGSCSAVEVQLQDGWLIKGVDMHRGVIENQFQFTREDSGLFTPVSQKNARVLQVRPMPVAYLEYYKVYPTSYPVDFSVNIFQPDTLQTSTLEITKTSCTPLKLGKTEVSVINGAKLNFYIRKSERYHDSWKLNKFSSMHFTSDFVLIPQSGEEFGEAAPAAQ